MLDLSKKQKKMSGTKQENPFDPFKDIKGLDIVDLKDVFIIHTENLSDIYNILRYPYKSEKYIFIGLCVKGEMVVSIGLRDIHIKALSLFSWMPPNILRIISYENCEVYVVAFNQTFAEKMNLDYGLIIPVLLYAQQNPILYSGASNTELTGSGLDVICNMYHNLYKESNDLGNNVFLDKMTQNLMGALIYRLCYMVSKDMSDETYPQSKESRYLYDFIKLLSVHCKTERSVGFYAKKLCITPKYLSSRLRMVSGMSAKEWIDNYLILEVKNLLKYSNMDVKEIAFALHFPNQSFFTQYFKRHTGMLPTEYRKAKD